MKLITATTTTTIISIILRSDLLHALYLLYKPWREWYYAPREQKGPGSPPTKCFIMYVLRLYCNNNIICIYYVFRQRHCFGRPPKNTKKSRLFLPWYCVVLYHCNYSELLYYNIIKLFCDVVVIQYSPSHNVFIIVLHT